MQSMTYIVTIKGVLAAAQAVGYDGSTILSERDVWNYMRETAQIAKEEGVEIKWIIPTE